MVGINVSTDPLVRCFAWLTLVGLSLTGLSLAGCAQSESNPDASILLFSGTGTSPSDVAAIAKILQESGLEYATANSKQLNGMSQSQLMAYRLIIVPGGNYITMGNHLTPEASRRIQNAVEQGV